jgi:hypothetical protein
MRRGKNAWDSSLKGRESEDDQKAMYEESLRMAREGCLDPQPFGQRREKLGLRQRSE